MSSTPYQRIMRAAKRGTGLRLSAEDAAMLSFDHAIVARAEWDDSDECQDKWHDTPWCYRRADTCPRCGEVTKQA